MGREQEESKSDVLKLFDQEEENSFNPPRTKPTQLWPRGFLKLKAHSFAQVEWDETPNWKRRYNEIEKATHHPPIESYRTAMKIKQQQLQSLHPPKKQPKPVIAPPPNKKTSSHLSGSMIIIIIMRPLVATQIRCVWKAGGTQNDSKPKPR